MADDNAKLVIVLEAQSRKLQNQLVATTRVIDKFAEQTNKRFDQMNAKNAASFDRLGANVRRSMGGLSSAIAPLLGALGTREIIGYADAWTTAGNKIAAAGQVAGRQGRSLEALNVIANDTRTGISETTDLYAKLLRSTKGVAKSEEEVARATQIVNKAFKAGGAATSEQIAGILQLSQGLGSGILQGDELRSLRENAPLLAQAIATEFGTTIAGLKALGAEGKLTSDRVFKAILNARSGIESAFNATNATITDSFTKVNNALTQYIGTADATKGAGFQLQAGLNALADNFDNVADVTLKLASVIAAALVGRAIGGMIVGLGTAGVAIAKFVTVARTAQGVGGLLTSLGGLGAAAGPIGAVVGTIAAGAVLHFATQSAIAAARTSELNAEMTALGLISDQTAASVDAVTGSVDALSGVERVRKIRQIREEIDAIRNGGSFDLQNLVGGKASVDLSNLDQISARAGRDGMFAGGQDKEAYRQIEELVRLLKDVPGYAGVAREKLAALAETDVSQGVLDLITATDRAAERLGALEGVMLERLGDTSQIDETRAAMSALIDEALRMPGIEFVSAGQVQSLKELQVKLLAGEKGADDARSALANLASLNPSFLGISEAMNPLADKLTQLIALAAAAAQGVAALAGQDVGANVRTFRSADAGSMASLDKLNANNAAFIGESERKAGLSKEALALEEEVARVTKAAQDAGGYLNSEQALAVARINLRGSESRSGGGGGKKENDYEKEAADILKRTSALQAETAAQAALNPLVNDYGFALERTKAQQELLTAATAAGLELTPTLKASIDELATGYANATVEAGKLAEAQENAAKSMEDWFALGKDATRGFIDDLIAGKSAAESLGNVFAKLGNQLLDMGLSSLSGKGGGDFGFIGKAFGFADGGIAANGRPKMFANGGVSRTAAVFGEAGPEAAVPLPDGRRIPVDLRMPTQANNGGGSVHAPISITIDATGADAAGLARVEQRLEQLKSELPGRIKQVVGRRSKDIW